MLLIRRVKSRKEHHSAGRGARTLAVRPLLQREQSVWDEVKQIQPVWDDVGVWRSCECVCAESVGLL